MNFGSNSNLVLAIKAAIDDCYEYGRGTSEIVNYYNDKMVRIEADWIESKHEGYSVIQVAILENDVVRFVYDDYGTECKL